VRVGTDVVSVMAAYSDLMCVYVWFTVQGGTVVPQYLLAPTRTVEQDL